MKEENIQNKKENSLLNTLWDWVKTIIVALAITFFIKMFIVDATIVSGKSMLNTLHDGDWLMVNKVGKHFRDYKRGEIVILNAPDFPNRLYVKRVIGVPGDFVELRDGDVYVNSEKLEEKYLDVDHTPAKTDQVGWVLGDNEYLVFGDNRTNSNDSRDFGQIYKEEIVGHAFFRIYPFADAGMIDNNPYEN